MHLHKSGIPLLARLLLIFLLHCEHSTLFYSTLLSPAPTRSEKHKQLGWFERNQQDFYQFLLRLLECPLLHPCSCKTIWRKSLISLLLYLSGSAALEVHCSFNQPHHSAGLQSYYFITSMIQSINLYTDPDLKRFT